MLSIRRRGFEAQRSPETAVLSVSARTPQLLLEEEQTDWQLAAGHYVSAKMPLRIQYPRPDSETATAARHRKAYADGETQYRIPVLVQGGAWPVHFELVTGPTGMSIGQDYWDSDYGVVTWTPSATGSAQSVEVLCTDQDGNSVTFTWTVTPSTSINDFVFISPSGDDTNGLGTKASPWQTLSKTHGTTTAATTYPGRLVYMRAGTYTSVNHDSSRRFRLASNKPIALEGYPGESVTLTIYEANLSVTIADTWIANMTVQGNTGNYESNGRAVHITNDNCHRITFYGIDFTDPLSGTDPTDNPTSVMAFSGNTYRQYLSIVDCSENGRSGGGQAYALHSLYTCQYVVIQGCQVQASADAIAYAKGSCASVSIRDNDFYATGGASLATGCQIEQGNKAFGPWEACYNRLRGIVHLNYGSFSSSLVEEHYFYRNTVEGVVDIRQENTSGVGPYYVENNVVVTNTTPRVDTGSQVTITGSEVHVGTSAGAIDSSGLLAGSYRTSYLGTRGHEIA